MSSYFTIIESCLTITVMLIMVVSPLLIPLGVHAAYAIANWRERYELLLGIVGRQRRAIAAA